MVVLACLGMLAVVGLPALAQSKPRTQRVTCANNLTWIGRAMNEWAGGWDDRMPWRLYVPPQGTTGNPYVNQAWYWYTVFSNELVTPKVLVCPSDPTVRAARDFSLGSTGSFSDSSHRNHALSYFLGLDSFAEAPTSILSGDWNIRVTGTSSSCSSGVRMPAAIPIRPVPSPVGWTASLHAGSGNLLLMDGRVEQTSTARLRELLPLPFDDQGMLHFLTPRSP
jgi:type II secretory pathway pseudopilin PulG